MAEPILKKYMESTQAESNPTEPNTDDDINIELSKEFLIELKNNAYHRMFDEDVVDHIAKVLELLDLIKIHGVDSHRLRMKVFPLSLADDARQWWINEGEGKITTWEELVEKFFCKFYPESHDGEDEMLDEGDNWGIDPLEFISRVNSSFENHMKVDGRTKKVLFHSWMNGSWNKRRMDNNILNNKEWKESDYGNPLNTATDSFFKAHDEHDIEEGNELRQMKRKEDNKNDEQPNKRVCKAEKFEAIKYSLGPNEEYIAIRRCEYNAWERNKDRPRCKEIDEVGEVLIIWNPMCVVVMLRHDYLGVTRWPATNHNEPWLTVGMSQPLKKPSKGASHGKKNTTTVVTNPTVGWQKTKVKGGRPWDQFRSIGIDIPVYLRLALVKQTQFHLSVLPYGIQGVCIGIMACRGLSLVSSPLHAMKSQSQIQSSAVVKFGGVTTLVSELLVIEN
ncbi:hypothetical protein Tco_0164346 [Tanacetum coccineum]